MFAVAGRRFFMKKNKKYFLDEYVYNYVKEQIFVTPPGGRLPGIRRMLKESGVGRVRLEKALQCFELENAIEVRPQSGRYRVAEPLSTVPQVFIHFGRQPVVENEASFTGGVVKVLREKARENRQSLEIINASDITQADLYKLLGKLKVRQAFVWGADNIKLLREMRSVVPYVVSILPRYPEKEISELRDSPDMTAVQLEYMFRCNYRRIAYIHNAVDWVKTPVQLLRLMDYYRIMAENGIKIEPEWVFFCAYNRETFNRSMHRLLRSGRAVQALIVPGSSLKMLYDFCANNGITIGRELAVMCSDDTGPDLIPRVTAVTNSPRDIGISAWEIMQNTIQGEHCCQNTNLRIITGETVPVINNPA